MNLKERYQNKANNLLSRLDEEEELDPNETMHCIPCGWEGKRSELVDGKKCPECGSTNVVPLSEYKKGKSEEEVRAAQDAPEPNGEEEFAEPDGAVQYKYLQDEFQKVVSDFGIPEESTEMAWTVWQKAIDTIKRGLK